MSKENQRMNRYSIFNLSGKPFTGADEFMVIIDTARRLQSLARSLHRLAEHECDYGLTPRQEKRQERLEAEAGECAGFLGLKAYIQRDPRGPAIYVYREGDLKEGESVGSRYPSIGVPVWSLR